MSEPDGPRAVKRPTGRSRFVSGQLLTPEDFEREQQYVREKLKRHNRTLHGFGIVSGLKVKMDSGQIVVEPGLALDCEGNEILIETPQSVSPSQLLSASDTPSSVTSLDMSSVASSGALSKALPSSASSPEVSQNALSSSASPPVGWHTAYLNVRFVEDFTTESFALEVARENCNRGHRHLRARWLACGQSHPLTIAKLRRRSHGWTVDRGYRPPTVK
jgi:hypothetical protein